MANADVVAEPEIDVRFGLLGPLRIEDAAGAARTVPAAKQRIVLGALLFGAGTTVSAASMAEALWDVSPPPNAPTVMRTYVMRLRRALGPVGTRIVGRPAGWAVELRGPEELDVTEVERLWRVARTAVVTGDWQRVSSLLTRAQDQWRGEPLIDIPSAALARREAARLAELRLQLTEVRIDADLHLGRHGALVADLRRLAAEHPLREHVRVQLMLACYRCGLQAAALEVYRDVHKALTEELGVEPGRELREMHQRILTADPDLLAQEAARVTVLQPPAPLPESVPPVPSPDGDLARTAVKPYVGRDVELAQVTQAAAETATGRLRIVLVTGDAGEGKTALAGQMSQRLTAEGWTVIAGRCPEHEGAPAGWPWAVALRRLAGTIPPARPQSLAALLTDDPAPDNDVAAARFRLHMAVGEYLKAVSRRAPLLVLLDDLHRADAETLAILTDVTADLGATRILVVATYRPAEETEHLRNCLAALAACEPTRISLRGLDIPAAGELIRATCTRPVDADTARSITERAGGNPFFISETARLFDAEGALAATTGVPAGVREVLQRRLAKLPVTAQTVLRQASVIGTEIDVAVLSDVSGAEENALLDAIEAGLVAGLVTEPGAGRIRFAHALVRDTLYQSLSRLRRARLHAQTADAIERHSRSEVAALAHHFLAAGTDPAKASHYCCLAAAQAEQRFAFHEAARLWEQATVCLDQVGGTPARDRVELVLHMVRALAHTGQLAHARSYRRDAIRAVLPLDDPALLARVITSFDVPMVWYSHEYGETDHELIGIVEHALTKLPPGDGPLRCRLLTTLAFELEGDESERGYQASAQAVEMARRLRDPDTLIMAINGRYLQSFRHDGQTERLSLGTELLALPNKPVNAEAIAHLLLMAANSGIGGFGVADLHAVEARRIADRYNLPLIVAIHTIYQAMRAGLDGDPLAAEHLYKYAADQINRLGLFRQGTGISILGRLSLLIMQDRVAEIAGEFDAYPRIPIVFSELYALALAAAGRVADAHAVVARPHPIRRDRFWFFMTVLRGMLAIALDDRERAESVYQALLPFAARPAGADTAVLTLWPTAQILGDLARYLQLPDADAHYRCALEVAEQARVDLWRKAATNRLKSLSPSHNSGT